MKDNKQNMPNYDDKTIHRIITCDSKSTQDYIRNKTIGLVVTSPPYPMVQMWDECFSNQSEEVKLALRENRFEDAFEHMHKALDKIWEDVDRVLMDGGVVCINIGDATRNCDGRFKLFSNHARIIKKFLAMGYDVLPDIHWHKPTNTPNKFMGSGMYPPCAYVTYEHEYILVFRKGGNRKFTNAEKNIRHNSAYFWEERNIWFSDLWEIKGTTQVLKKVESRSRSAAFPFEIAYRLINMYSLQYDFVYDPFSGTGTVTRAAMASKRNSIGIDIDAGICKQAISKSAQSMDDLNLYTTDRIRKHKKYIEELPAEKREKLYENVSHSFKVKTRQETEISITLLNSVKTIDDKIVCFYEKVEGLTKTDAAPASDDIIPKVSDVSA